MAKELARKIGYIYIDSGAMYRAVTLYAMRNDLFTEEGIKQNELKEKMDDILISFKLDIETQRPFTCLNGEVVEDEELQQYLDEILGREEDNLPEDLEISQSTLEAIFSGMESVTGDSGGTAYNTFKDFGVKVAGKTGTVQVGGGKADNAWFLGFAPYDDPEIAICAVIEQGSHGTYTASIVKAILEEYFALKQENENIDTNAVVNNNQMM
jgi:hypothetical protein